MKRKSCFLWLIAVAGLAVAGCAPKFTYERWQTVHIGATPEVVTATLGDPWQRQDRTWVYYDTDRQITATMIFTADKLARATWSGPDHPMEARGELIDQPGQAEEIKVQTIDQK